MNKAIHPSLRSIAILIHSFLGGEWVIAAVVCNQSVYMGTYAALLTGLLKAGLADLGFTKTRGYLIRDMGECVGGVNFQKSKYDDNRFFVEVGVLSKRLDRFNLQFMAENDTHPYHWMRAQFRHRLTSPVADRGDDQWTITPNKPIAELVSRLAPLLKSEAVRIFDALGTDAKMLSALTSDADPCGIRVLRGQEWPAVPTAYVYAAVLADAISPEQVGTLKRMAMDSAETPLLREQVIEQLANVGKRPIAPEDMLPEEALAELRELTGQDFGSDYQAWQNWLKNHPIKR